MRRETGLSPPVRYFYWPFQCGTSFLDHLCYLCLVFVVRSHLFIAALWPPAGKGLTSWLLFVIFIVISLLSHLVSWDRCGTWLYRFLILVVVLTSMILFAKGTEISWAGLRKDRTAKRNRMGFVQWKTVPGTSDQGPKLQCLLKVKEDLSMDFYDAKNNVSNLLKSKYFHFFLYITVKFLTISTASIHAIYFNMLKIHYLT